MNKKAIKYSVVGIVIVMALVLAFSLSMNVINGFIMDVAERLNIGDDFDFNDLIVARAGDGGTATGSTSVTNLAATFQVDNLTTYTASEKNGAFSGASAKRQYVYDVKFNDGALLTAIKAGKVNIKIDVSGKFEGYNQYTGFKNVTGGDEARAEVGLYANNNNAGEGAATSAYSNSTAQYWFKNGNTEVYTIFNGGGSVTDYNHNGTSHVNRNNYTCKSAADLLGSGNQFRLRFFTYAKCGASLTNSGKEQRVTLNITYIKLTFTYNNFTTTVNVTGDGSVSQGTTVANTYSAYGAGFSTTATANTGSYFSGWASGSTSKSRTITTAVPATTSGTSITYTANFTAMTVSSAATSYTYNTAIQGPHITNSPSEYTVRHIYSGTKGDNSAYSKTSDNDSGAGSKPVDVGTYSYYAQVYYGTELCGTSSTYSFTIGKYTPAINNVTQGNTLYYGQRLGDIISNPVAKGVNNADVSGGWSWSGDGATVQLVPNAAAYTYTLYFTSANYNYADTQVNVTFNAVNSTPQFVSASVVPITYGQPLAALSFEVEYRNAFDNTMTVSGSWEWVTSTIAFPIVSQSGLWTYQFTPSRPDLYNTPAEREIDITVNHATPLFRDDVSSTIIDYGKNIRKSIITGTAYNPYHEGDDAWIVSGGFQWEANFIPTVAESGDYNVIFTVVDTANYNHTNLDVLLTVIKHTPNEKAGTVGSPAIIYEQPLSDIIPFGTILNTNYLPSEEEITGEWFWDLDKIALTSLTVAMPEVLKSAMYAAYFVPDNLDDYNIYYTTALLTVNPKTQTVNIPSLENADNPLLKTDVSGLADFEIPYTEGAIYITITSTAVYPSVRRSYLDVTTGSQFTLTPVLISSEVKDGKSVTVYSLPFNPAVRSGMITFSAYQDDANVGVTTGAEGNYINASSVETYSVYIKMPHILSGFTDIDMTYGDLPKALTAVLSSGMTNYQIDISETGVITYAAGAFTVVAAGGTEVTLSHTGGLNAIDNEVYMSVSGTITVTVAPKAITVGIEDQTVTYGTPPEINYTLSGMAYGEGLEVLTGLTNDYADGMKNVGPHTVTPSGVTNGNYTVTYDSAAFIVNPKTVTVTIKTADDAREFFKVYADALTQLTPDLEFEYDGFVYGEDEYTAAGVVRPTPVIDANQFSNVGRYGISLSAASADNYTFNVSSTATLVITPRQVDFENLDVEYDPGFDPIISFDVAGYKHASATVPEGTTKIEYAIDDGSDIWDELFPNIIDEDFIIRITFYPIAGDNYGETSKEYPSSQNFNPIAPVMEIAGRVTADYTAGGIAMYGAVALPKGRLEPKGTLSYQYRENGTQDAFVSALPVNVGKYDVRVLYTPATGEKDGFSDGYQDFEDALEIFSVFAILDLSVNVKTYSTDGSAPVKVSALSAVVEGLGKDKLTLGNTGEVEYLYYTGTEYSATFRPFNVGVYKVKVIYTPTDPNYKVTEEEFDGAIDIRQAKILSLQTLLGVVGTYNGVPLSANEITMQGLAGGSAPLGTLSYLYTTNGIITSPTPYENVGSYGLIVTYTAGANDNYATETYTFNSAVVINPANPLLSLEVQSVNFDARPRSARQAVVNAIAGGSQPTGSCTYQYAPTGTTNWATSAPVNAGIYDVKVIYAPGDNDNYGSYSQEFTARLIINTVNVTVQYLKEIHDYTGLPTNAGNIRIIGVAADAATPEGDIIVRYKLSGTSVWTTDAPVNSGIYDVEIAFVAKAGTNYKNTEFTGGGFLEIKRMSPRIELSKVSVVYNAQSQKVGEANITSSAPAFGSFKYEYAKTGTTGFATTLPITAGVYDVRVTYMQAGVDNYSSAVVTFEGALTIRPMEVFVEPLLNQSKVYDAAAISGAGIQYSATPLLAGHKYSGTLQAGSSANVGDYLITIGTLTAGENYTITFTKNRLFSITPKEIELVFGVINPVYDGREKLPAITIAAGSVYENDEVLLSTLYAGNNTNVGSFYAFAKLTATNYILPAESRQEYVITPAKMTGNVFANVKVVYDGQAHALVMTQIMEGAAVIYDAPTLYTNRGAYVVNAYVTRANYTTEILTATLTIEKAVYDIRPYVTVETLTYGDPMPRLFSNVTAGTISFDDGQDLAPGETEYNWTFVPFDLTNYDVVTGKIKLNVKKAEVQFELTGAMMQYANNPQLFGAKVIGADDAAIPGEVSIKYISSETGKEYAALPTKAGVYLVQITFKGNEYYAEATFTTEVVIKEPFNYLWLAIGGGAVAILIIASALYYSSRRRSSARRYE